jgi:hypothetical protein
VSGVQKLLVKKCVFSKFVLKKCGEVQHILSLNDKWHSTNILFLFITL